MFVTICQHTHCLLSTQERMVDEAADTQSESVSDRPSGKRMYVNNPALSSILSLNLYLVVVLQRKYHTWVVVKRPALIAGKWCSF